MTTLTRILLVDDDQVDRASVRRALSASDLTFELSEAADGKSGLQLAEQTSFDCVLLDYRLPDADALDLLATLQSPDGGRQTVLMLTGEEDSDVAIRLMRAGALDYLTKAHLSPPTLARAIRYAKARQAFVRELEAARQEAEAKSAALDELNRQKSLLFSIIAHDLRNPFQVLMGVSRMIERAAKTQDAAALQRGVGALRQATSQAFTLMEGLFNWAQVQMETAVVPLERCDLSSIVADASQNCAQAAADKNVEIVTTDCGNLAVLSQAEMLMTIIRNLVSNAVKFTPSAGQIVVRASAQPASAPKTGTCVRIEVSDNGVGMTPGAVDDLFKPHRRMTTVGTAGEQGSGLGLLLCRDLAERLGADLTVASTLGAGTTFSLVLPAA